FFTDPHAPGLYTLSLHDALPIWASTPSPPAPGCPQCSTDAGPPRGGRGGMRRRPPLGGRRGAPTPPSSRSAPCWASRSPGGPRRSEEHTSELQSRGHLVCRLLLE